MISSEEIVTGMQVLGRVPDLLRRAESGSLSEYVSEARVEPPVLVDERARHLSYISDVMHAANSLYSGYYLQAWALSTNVGRIDVRQVLDGLNDKRRITSNVGGVASRFLSTESYRFGLPQINDEKQAFESSLVTSRLDDAELPDYDRSQGFGRDTTKYAQDAGNLSVGRLLEVNIEDQGSSATIPVSVRLNVSILEPSTLINILTIDSGGRSAKDRFHQWRSGRIEFLRDVVLQQDLIDQHKRTLMRDGSGYYKELIRKRNTNKISAILSMNPSVGTAATIVVLTAQTAKALDRELGGTIEDVKTREQMFRKTYSTIMFVIDTEYEQVDIYHRGIDRPTELSLRDLKSVNSKTGPDISEIMKAYQMGRSISL